MPAAPCLVPEILKSVILPGGRIELVEGRWPSPLKYIRAESEFMLEMSLPPLSEDTSASFSRNFRRSTGLSPQQFRQCLQGPDQPI